jgi:hypothetical protein
MPRAESGPKAKHWSFTLNNPTPEDVDRLLAVNGQGVSLLPGVEYIIFGREVGESGTPHLQGTVCFQSRKVRSQAIQIIGQAHFTTTRYLSQSIEYCKKDGNFSEVGTAPAGKGGRSDLEDFKDTVKEGITCMDELIEAHSEIYAKYPRFVREYVDGKKTQHKVALHPLREWQQSLHTRLATEPNEREIIFIVDQLGNQGKSWFARYYCDYHKNAQIIVPGKKADMAYVVREECRVFFLDCPRSKQGDFIQYDFPEELKNGYLFSPKYESRLKKFPTPHIVVCMNEMPEMSKLSNDRYSITVLCEP